MFGREIDIRIDQPVQLRVCIATTKGWGRQPRAAHPDEMTPDHIETLVRIAREFNIRSVKLTGGEPLIRSDIVEIIERIVHHIADVSMTTNGSMLASKAGVLRSAGLKRVNVSMDSLEPQAFQEIRKGSLAPVLEGIGAALGAGLKPVKLNMVVFKKTVYHIPAMIDHIGRTEG